MIVEWLLLAAVVVLIAANATFVAAEFALVTVDRPTVSRLSETDAKAASLREALRTMSTQLSGAQLGITITSLVVGFIAEPSIAALLEVPIEAVGLPEETASVIAFTAAFLIATVVQMVFGELVPKNWAIAEPLKVGRAVVGFQRAFTWVSRPLLWFLNGTANRLVRAFGMEPQEELASARSAQELGSLAARSARQGLLGEDLARRLEHSVALGERTASDAMTPRPRVRFLELDQTAADVLDAVRATGHARFPVTGDSVDDVRGVVHFKDAVAVPAAERATTPVAGLIRPMRAVPSTMPLGPVLEVLRRGVQMAVVVDEYGGTDGIVTLEDVVEEIVGEIDDEQDRPTRAYRELGERRWSLSGLLRPDEAGETLHLELPEGRESDTLGGLITEELERFPRIGDQVVLAVRDESRPDDDGLPSPAQARLTVTRLDGWRVDRLTLAVEDLEEGEQNA
ncbi:MULTISPECIES: hemolysin family protein [Tessaracoccus]|uniref:hemolysin family protein n=1 Tax=Tessaracoccus TaxID=72763 RepID=UPI00099C6FAB|nr:MULTISPECIES: hemolysin family protein [Tessaracoccus]VEP39815.1 Magnesium and cobalt efflux protein CorC [Tessaracoccus lapidicaptus]